MSRRRWQEWRSRGDPAIIFRLLPPTPDKPGRLVIEEGALSTVVVLTWEAPLIAVHLAGKCPCCNTMLVARAFGGGHVRGTFAPVGKRVDPAGIATVPALASR